MYWECARQIRVNPCFFYDSCVHDKTQILGLFNLSCYVVQLLKKCSESADGQLRVSIH